jgi:hypothetical protein
VLFALCLTFGFARFAVSSALRQLCLARLESRFQRVKPRRVSVIWHMFAEIGQSHQSLLDLVLKPSQPVRPLAFSIILRNNCASKRADE